MLPSKVLGEDIFNFLESKNVTNDNLNRLNITTGDKNFQVSIPVPTNIYIWTIISVSVIGIIGNWFW